MIRRVFKTDPLICKNCVGKMRVVSFIHRASVIRQIKYSASPQGRQVIHDVERKIERLGVPSGVSIKPALVSTSGVTPAA